jgi:hypothetical protein
LRGLGQAAGGVLGAAGQVLVAAAISALAGGDAIHRLAHLQQHLHVALAHGLDFVHQRADFVAAWPTGRTVSDRPAPPA